MKIFSKLFPFLSIFASTVLFAQDLKKMNKTELKEELIILNSKIDSLKQATQKLTRDEVELQAKITDLEQKSNKKDTLLNSLYLIIDEKEKQIDQLKQDVQKLSKTISENEMESKKKLSDKELEILKLKEEIKTLSNTIFEDKILKKQIDQELQLNQNLLEDKKLPYLEPDYLSIWFEKLLKSKMKFDLSKANFNSTKYNSQIPKDLIGIWDINEELNLSQLIDAKIETTYSDKQIIFKIQTGWNHTFFALEEKFIYSVHHGSSGEAMIYNFVTKKIHQLNYEIIAISNGIAEIHQSWHDANDGHYVSRNGKCNLQNGKVTWGPEKNY